MTPKEAFEAIRKEFQDRLDFPINLTPEYRLVKQALTELEELKQEVKDRQETEDSLTKWVADLTNELNELKRYPTSKEVCEALSKYYGDIVSYSNERHNHMFYFEESKLGILRLLNNGVYFIQSDYHKTNALPPHLITLIGRFYEGLGK